MLLKNSNKIVLDTCVLIRALMNKSNNSKKDNEYVKIFNLMDANRIIIMTNHKILTEYSEQINKKVREETINAELGSKYLNLIRAKSVCGRELINPPIFLSQDPKDNIFLASENCIYANYLITEDHHFEEAKADLIELNSKMLIVTAKEFIKIYDK